MFARYKGSVVFRLVCYKSGHYDITNGMKERLNIKSIKSHDEAMDFILKYALDNNLKNVRYVLIESKEG